MEVAQRNGVRFYLTRGRSSKIQIFAVKHKAVKMLFHL